MTMTTLGPGESGGGEAMSEQQDEMIAALGAEVLELKRELERTRNEAVGQIRAAVREATEVAQKTPALSDDAATFLRKAMGALCDELSIDAVDLSDVGDNPPAVVCATARHIGERLTESVPDVLEAERERRKPDYWIAKRDGEFFCCPDALSDERGADRFVSEKMAARLGTPVPVYVGDPPPARPQGEPDGWLGVYEGGAIADLTVWPTRELAASQTSARQAIPVYIGDSTLVGEAAQEDSAIHNRDSSGKTGTGPASRAVVGSAHPERASREGDKTDLRGAEGLPHLTDNPHCLQTCGTVHRGCDPQCPKRWYEKGQEEEPEREPGEPICCLPCPCCGAELEICHGDDPGAFGVFATAPESERRDREVKP